MRRLCTGLFLLLWIALTSARKHHLEIRDDMRQYIPLSSFGFYAGGVLDVRLSDFRTEPDLDTKMVTTFGFSLDKTASDAMNPYLDTHQDHCILKEPAASQNHGPIVLFSMNMTRNELKVEASADWPNVRIKSDNKEIEPIHVAGTESSGIKYEPIPMVARPDGPFVYYSFNFTMYVDNKLQEGLYNLYFHNCPNYVTAGNIASFNLDLEESNFGNYLSAGEMPLPALYFIMSFLFFLSALFWLFILRRTKHPVFKIHYLMAVLVFLKALSLMFHAINFHFIQIKGEHVETWAVLYYITHLIKGAVLFVTIILIGTGWTFIKHILADKDKKLFMIVIPLQVLANVAEIIIAESEEGDKEHSTWRDIFILVDLLCCGCILFPVVWSIRHLQDASATDGKAAINLRKLKLFRQFYIMIVCYIYFTRIIIYLLKITVAFQYAWLDEFFREMATFIFFVLTGYKFRPVSQHPYFTMGDTDDDESEVEILTQSGITEGLSKVTNRTQQTSTIVEHNEDERENLISKRESSHEYD
ncbi:protein GPR107 [Culicoides brevitarsis]|uniref:protein GPR107 n=1 Tax=Culicoides brevitarsis TaxID=469753 RepID=UPI00307C303C